MTHGPATLTLVNTNRMTPPIAPLGVEYVGAAARAAGVDVRVVDLCLAADPQAELAGHFAAARRPDLVGLSFRNVDDCFWPSGQSFLPDLAAMVAHLRTLTDAPICLGGVGYSIFARRVVEYTGADFGIRGDGEQAVVALLAELTGRPEGRRRLDRVLGLVWREGAEGGSRGGGGGRRCENASDVAGLGGENEQPAGRIHVNSPAWPASFAVPPTRDAVDNAAYFRLGGQAGVETKRGCPRRCIYCADPLAKGTVTRLREPAEVADEFAALAGQGCDVIHICDGEFNIPGEHAAAVCDELIRRRLGQRVRWYTYMAVLPFDAELADKMRRAGCVGINFTSDAAAEAMLRSYRLPHRKEDLTRAVGLCREHGMSVMLDLLLGGPGETPETVAESIEFFRRLGPDCIGAPLGLRVYPGTPAEAIVAAEGPMEANPAIRRKYTGPVDLLWPTFYISAALGPHPARLVRELIAGDRRFFEPEEETPAVAGAAPGDADLMGDHNYNANEALVRALAAGQRGAYWDILRKLRGSSK